MLILASRIPEILVEVGSEFCEYSCVITYCSGELISSMPSLFGLEGSSVVPQGACDRESWWFFIGGLSLSTKINDNMNFVP